MILQGAILLTVLSSVAVYDLRKLVIPDVLNVLLAVLGALFAFQSGKDALSQGALASVLGGGFLLLVRAAYEKYRGVIGLGLGDVKFMFAAGFWISPLHLPWLLLIASVSGLVAAVSIYGLESKTRMPFGPHLAIGLFACWLLKVNNVL